ncbi:hypothetical protein [Pedobacter yulinensis]|uniref:hypothetical protein n=1 Tax=Pedobacter yulinensis TaxID=2126353 RepID=UPI00195508EE|nr:hypothetical protein [Pedobacter yulinensis]
MLRLYYSPVAALNHTFALSKVHGKAVALAEAEKLNLAGNPYYHTLLGELYRDADRDKAPEHFRLALAVAGNGADGQAIRLTIETL